MTGREFLEAVSNGGDSVLNRVLSLLKKARAKYCVIGGLAVNAYVDPVVSLDLDLVVVSGALDAFLESGKGSFKIERFQHSVNLTWKRSDLRIQVQTDPRYQAFLSRGKRKKVLGHFMTVASLEDVIQGKLWAYSDPKRRASKRQKDLADIYRLVESYPHLKRRLPRALRDAVRSEE